jgi:hypothetical protein
MEVRIMVIYRKVVGSISDEVIGFINRSIPFSRIMELGRVSL